jgi:hypothetical protein
MILVKTNHPCLRLGRHSVTTILFLKSLTSTPPPSERATIILFLKPSTSTPLYQSAPSTSTSTPLPQPPAKVTPFPPPSLPLPCECFLDLKNICSLMWLFVRMWMKYDCVCRVWVNLTQLSWSHYYFVDFMEFSDSLVNFSEIWDCL